MENTIAVPAPPQALATPIQVVVSPVVPLGLEVELSDDDLEQVTGGLARIPLLDAAS